MFPELQSIVPCADTLVSSLGIWLWSSAVAHRHQCDLYRRLLIANHTYSTKVEDRFAFQKEPR